MRVKEIKELPHEFDFRTKLNTFGFTYHAKEDKHVYIVTYKTHKWTIEKADFRRKLFFDEFVVLK